jgi:hypothetical protein
MKKSEKYLALTIIGILIAVFGTGFAAINGLGPNGILSIMLIGTVTCCFGFYNALNSIDKE